MDFLRYAAKAVAAFAVPWVLWFLGVVAEWLGIEQTITPDAVEALIVSVLTSPAVYRVANRVPAPREWGP